MLVEPKRYGTRDLTPEEAKALTEDLKAVLEKHGAELSVLSSIQLLKYVEEENKEEEKES